MPTPITSKETSTGPVKSNSRQNKSGAPVSLQEELEALKRSLQEQRRATTLLNSEVQRQAEAREALEAQLIEANAEIAASWERRKEMTRVIADRDARLGEAKAELGEAKAELGEAKAELEASRSRLREADEMERELAELRSEMKATRERRKEIARVVANRDDKISQLRADISQLKADRSQLKVDRSRLKAELHARYEELAHLQRHIARSSISGRARRLMQPITKLLR